MYSLATSRDIPIVLMIFPFDFQLLRPDLRQPQAILQKHAAKHGVDVIDFTDIFARAVYDDPELVGILQNRGLSPEEVQQFYSWRIARYFLDNDHFTEEGHGLIANALLDYLISSDEVGPKLSP
jgi:lysophospholipase L1-like esterase